MVKRAQSPRSLWRQPDKDNAGDVGLPPISKSPLKTSQTTAHRRTSRMKQGKTPTPSLPASPRESSSKELEPIPSLKSWPAPRALEVAAADAGERAPEWLAIFFDLAWTATFSNLTSNTGLTTPSTLQAYIVFFVLAWWLWVTQVLYNVKYHTDDWFHRGIMLSHLFIFGALSAFTANFSLLSPVVDPDHSSPADIQQNSYTYASMLGISGLLACTRFLLSLSYARVLFYAWKQNIPELRRRLCALTLAYFVSCLLFSSAFTVVKSNMSPGSRWVRLALWLCGIAVEVAAFTVLSEVSAGYIRNQDTMGDRLTTLTTVILGEGINSIAAALVFSTTLNGFLPNPTMGSTALIVALGFYMYIAGPRREYRGSKKTILLHFPLHLSLIVLLEALKNMLVFMSLVATIQHFSDRANTPKKGETSADALDAAYGNLGLDLKAIAFSQLTYGNLTRDDVNELVNKAAAQAYLKIFQDYQLADDEFSANFTTYLRTNGGQARFDHPDAHLNNFTVEPWITNVLHTQQTLTVSIPISAGAFMITLGLLVFADEPRRRHRYTTVAAITRLVLGSVLALTATAVCDKNTWHSLNESGSLAHIVAGVFFFQFLLDQALAWVTKRHVSKQETSADSESLLHAAETVHEAETHDGATHEVETKQPIPALPAVAPEKEQEDA
ncbi:hypothetical protein EXIGLDRAFT_830298 [Exidia glandulosa HHB12029]|uniref:Low temperature requirement A n=1 Tax=Exidia glandulosa HHB12029 TaxID=1314781 RepID=A0A165NRM6_EXIGL|nr:hypothetical protein EXIGLDRAFT_830298 [Exidia glandulosa HHB12029]